MERRQPNKSDNTPAPVREAVRRAQQGDNGAFEFLYRLYGRRVYSLCLRMVRDAKEAEDLTQEAFLQMFRKIHTFRGESAFSTWLHSLTVNLVLMRFRKKRLRPISLDDMSTTDQEDSGAGHELHATDLRLAGVFDRIDLQKATGRLPKGYKAVFLLHDVQGYNHNEIAKLLGFSVGGSKSQLHRARRRLRSFLRRIRQRVESTRAQRPGNELANYDSVQAV